MEVMEILKLNDSLDEDAYEGIYDQWISYFIGFILFVICFLQASWFCW